MDLLSVLREQWKSLLQMLPRGLDLETTVRQSGCLQRRREIKDAETLLRLALVYGLSGLSLRGTAAWAQVQGVADLSDVALLKQLRQAACWLAQLLGAKLAERVEGWRAALPRVYRLRIVDATTVSTPGSRGTDYRIHLGLDLSSLQIDRIELTGSHGGETFSRLALEPGELILADRGYAHRSGLVSVRQAGAEFLVRINWQNLPLQDAQQQRLDLIQLLEQIPKEEAVEFEVWTVADATRGLASLPARLIVQSKPEPAAEAERQRIRRAASRKGRQADARSLIAAGYFLVLTSVPPEALSASQALELYRLRWQIEMTFKRLKGLLCLGEVSIKDPRLVQSYLCAKLLAALMLEDLTQGFLAFSPCGTSAQASQSVEDPAGSSRSDVLRCGGSAELLRLDR
jgi:Transposase DDE domain